MTRVWKRVVQSSHTWSSLDFEFVNARLTLRRPRGMRPPAIDQTFARLVAYSDSGVGAFSDACFQARADARALWGVQVAVSDV